MRIPSGVTDQYIYFVAVDSTDFATRETGLATFTVYRSRNGGTAAAMTTPTINETDATNMPGVYELLLDEDMTIDSGDDSQEMAFHITHAGMAPVTRTIELYRPKITAGNTLDVTSTGAAGIDWGNVENQSTSVDLSATAINLCDTVTTNTDMRGTDSALLAASAPTNFGDLAIAVTTGYVTVGTNNDKTGYSISGSITTLDGLPTVAAIADAVWDEAQSGHVGAGTFGEIATEIASILVDTAEIGAAGAGLTAVPWNASWDAEVQSECADAITAASLATAANLATVDTVVDAIKVVTDAIPDSGAMTSIATAAALTTVDTVVDAIKAKTDSLTFTVAGQVDANIQSINDVTITGNGQTGTEFGV